MLKKFISILLCCCTVFLCACSARTKSDSKENNTESNTNTQSQTQTTTAKKTQSTSSTTSPPAKDMQNIEDLSTTKVVWGSGTITDHKQPDDPKQLQKTFSSLGGQWLLSDEKSICLTFDEGYENGYTPQILDTLKSKKVKAVFFVTYDFAKENPKLIQRMIDEGHIVGNHTYRHYTMDEVSTDTAKEEVSVLHDYIKKEFNYTMSYFRFPKGEFSQQSLAIVQSLGYKSVFWSYAYADWDTDNQPDATESFKAICESTHPGEIMLLHAVSKVNAEILGKVIDDCKKQGYSFTTKIK